MAVLALTIRNDSGEFTLTMQIPDVDLMLALPAIIKALADLSKPLGTVRRKPVSMPEAS